MVRWFYDDHLQLRPRSVIYRYWCNCPSERLEEFGEPLKAAWAEENLDA